MSKATTGTLWKHSNGRWYILYGPKGKQRVSTGTTDYEQAKIFLAQWTVDSQSAVIKNPTIGQILDGYKEDHGQKVFSKGTLACSVRHLKDHLGSLKVEHLTEEVIEQYATSRKTSVKDGTILRELSQLRGALAWAGPERKKWIKEKPVIYSPVEAPLPRYRWLTRDEAKRLLAGCLEPHVRLFVKMALGTVPRMSALLEAKWDQINWETKTIDYGKYVPARAGKRRPVVPLNDELIAVLKEAQEVACSDHIIEYNGKPLKTIKNAFRAARERAGLGKDVTAHILRHTGATWMALAGIPMREIANMLGDNEITVTKVYAKFHPSYLKNASNALMLGDDEPLPETRKSILSGVRKQVRSAAEAAKTAVEMPCSG